MNESTFFYSSLNSDSLVTKKFENVYFEALHNSVGSSDNDYASDVAPCW